MRQLYIRKFRHMTRRDIPVGVGRLIGRIYMNCTIFACALLHNAEFAPVKKNLILIGTARSYLAVILPNMDLVTGGECG